MWINRGNTPFFSYPVLEELRYIKGGEGRPSYPPLTSLENRNPPEKNKAAIDAMKSPQREAAQLLGEKTTTLAHDTAEA